MASRTLITLFSPNEPDPALIVSVEIGQFVASLSDDNVQLVHQALLAEMQRRVEARSKEANDVQQQEETIHEPAIA